MGGRPVVASNRHLAEIAKSNSLSGAGIFYIAKIGMTAPCAVIVVTVQGAVTPKISKNAKITVDEIFL